MDNQVRELQLFPMAPRENSDGKAKGFELFGSEETFFDQFEHPQVTHSVNVDRVPVQIGIDVNASKFNLFGSEITFFDQFKHSGKADLGQENNVPVPLGNSDVDANRFNLFGSKETSLGSEDLGQESNVPIWTEKSDEYAEKFNLFGKRERCVGAGDSLQESKVPVQIKKSVESANRFSLSVSNNRTPRVCDRAKKEKSPVSDCESGTSLIADELIKLSEDEWPYQMIRHKFISGLGNLGTHTRIEAIHRLDYSGYMRRARLQTFLIYSEAVDKKCGGGANLKYAWFGASKDEISKIISHGFSLQGESENNGIHLYADDYPLQSVHSSDVDERGLRHTLLCRVITGKMEVVNPGSGKYHPSSEEFDIGVDDLLTPKKYFVWTGQIGSHVLPEFVISFRAPPELKVSEIESQVPVKKPISPRLPFSFLISELSKFLPPSTFKEIRKYHSDQQEKKISRQEFILRLRQVAGDKLLASMIISYTNEQHQPSTS